MGNKCNSCKFSNIENNDIDLSLSKNQNDGFSKNLIFTSTLSVKNYNIIKDYNIIKKLGKGSYASVYLVIHIKTNSKRSMKMIKKKNLLRNIESKMLEEISILQSLDHPNIVKLYEVFEDHKYYYLIIEYCKGGELFDAIKKVQSFNENQASKLMFQLFSSINYCHKKGIIHRDIKPENLVFSENRKNNPLLKLIDFGVSIKFVEGNKFNEKNGTIYYISPEVFKNDYDEKCDVWSCGIIMYILLCGYPPFNGETDEEIQENILNNKLMFYYNDWKNISSSAVDWIKKILVKNPKKRISLSEIFEHEWIKNNNFKKELDNNFLKNINNFQIKSELKKVVMNYVANQMNFKNEKNELINLFKSIDKNNDGVLTRSEFFEAFKINYKFLTDEEILNKIDKIFELVDIDKNEELDFTEFVTMYISQSQKLNNKMWKKTFLMLDSDNNGYIDKHEFAKLWGNKVLEDDEWTELIKDIDKNNDGHIDFDEFTILLKKEIF